MAAPLLVTPGDPSGIGREITLKAWLARQQEWITPFVLMDDPAQLQATARDLGLSVVIEPLASLADAEKTFPRALPVWPVSFARPAIPGKPDPANARAIIQAIEMAVRLTQSGEAAALVTNPIHKAGLYEGGFHFPGHTEFLAHLTGAQRPVMMLAGPDLRTVPLTVHRPLRAVPDDLRKQDILAVARIVHRSLVRDFGLAQPRLVVAGLNPHAGEGGAMGDEEARVIAPAVEELRAEGMAIAGPLPADTLFHARARAGYDAALCMYHDQALIPVKTLDFDRTVNVTLGLPIIRTSPDHGTAFDIAGRNKANPASLIAALHLARQMAQHRFMASA